MTTYTDRVCAALTDLIRSRTEWDEAPGLYFIYTDNGTMRLSEESIVPDAIWPEVPTYGLAAVAGTIHGSDLGRILRAVAPPNLIGTVFRCEMWGVAMPVGAPGRGHAEEMHRQRRLAEHPDRTEQRIAWAVLRDGAQFTAMQDRGSDEVTARRVTGTKGLIPDSLARITRAIKAEVN